MDPFYAQNMYKFCPNIQDVVQSIITSLERNTNEIVDVSILCDILKDSSIKRNLELNPLEGFTDSVFDKICCRLLRRVIAAETIANFEYVKTICELTESIFKWGIRQEKQVFELLNICVELFNHPSVVNSSIYGSDSQNSGLQIITAISLIKIVSEAAIQLTSIDLISPLKILGYLKENVWSCIVKILYESDNNSAGKLLSSAIIPMLKLCDKNKELLHETIPPTPEELELVKSTVLLTDLWNKTKSEAGEIKTRHGDICEVYTERQLLVLCCLSDRFFPADDLKNSIVVGENSFWDIVQRGMMETNSLCHKRSVYLLKRVIDTCDKSDIVLETDLDCKFCWSCADKIQLSRLWEDFLLLVESLEETQAHLVKPLFPKVKHLISATVTTESSGNCLFHLSWLVVLFQRCLNHNSISIMRWAVITVLDLDMPVCKKICRNERMFVCSTFIKCLQEMKLYARSQDDELGATPEVAEKLVKFFKNCWLAFDDDEQRGAFFRQILRTLSDNYWSGVSLMFICQALARVPVSPLLDRQAMFCIRDLITRHVSSMETYIRGASQCFLLQTFIRLIDIKSVLFDEFVSTVSMFSAEECLRRNTGLWKECSDGLQCLLDTGDKDKNDWSREHICSYLTRFHQDLMKFEHNGSLLKDEDSRKFCRVILLIEDTNTTKHIDTTLGIILNNLFHALKSVNTHAYMSPLTADRSLHLIMVLHKEIGKGELKFHQCVRDVLRSCRYEIIQFIKKRIIEDVKTFSEIVYIDLYCGCIKMMLVEASDEMISAFEQLVQCCIHALQNMKSDSVTESLQVSMFSCMKILGSIAEELGRKANIPQNSLTTLLCEFAVDILNFKLQKQTGVSKLMMTVCNELSEFVTRGITSYALEGKKNDCVYEDWGKFTSEYMTSQWYCLHLLLKIRHADMDIIDKCLEALDTCSCPTVIPIFMCLKYEVIKSEYREKQVKILEALKFCWKRVEEQEKKPPYRTVLKAFVESAYQPTLLKYPADSKIIDYLMNLAKSFIENGEDRSFSTNILTSHLCQIFSSSDFSSHLLKWTQIIIEMLVFGGIRKQNRRYVLEACSYIESLGTRCSINELSEGISKTDLHTRTNAVNFISQLQTEDANHILFVKHLLESLVKRHQNLLKTKEYRSYANSVLHRKKNRVAQIFVLLLPYIQEESADILWKHLWKALSVEPQPSVRNLLEWAVVMLIQKFPPYLMELFEKLNSFTDSRSMCIYSVMMILSFMGPLLTSEKQVDFYEKTIHFLLPWCLAQHFNARIYAQGSLMKVWKQCQELQVMSVLESCKLVDSCINFNLHNSNSTKNIEKLMKHYLFSTFDINRDFSIETIFHTLPRLSKMNEDEWIPCELFIQLDQTWNGAESRIISLHNPSDELQNCDPGVWKFKVSDAIEDTESTEGDIDGSFNVQKKSEPWKTMLPEDDIITFGEFRKQKAPHGKLVVITSLIDKIPNLGGLCRTSEIFGVAEFVMANLRNTEDKVFQVLSVTSHKWLPLTEVSPLALPEYLDTMRNKGYTLVGVEQTANSISLSNYQFPEKTILILGNEKEGIPVELINILDVCIEIPQHGVVRSLNVHVSGAIVIWEYTRQQLTKT